MKPHLKLLTLLCVVAASAVMLSACSHSDNTPPPPAPAPAPEAPAPVEHPGS